LLFALAIAVPIITAILNYGFWEGGLGARYRVISPFRIEQVSGGFAWRFFEWHIFGGNGAVTSVDRILADLGFPLSFAQDVTGLIDFGNPTPFHIFAILAGAAFFFRKPRVITFSRKVLVAGYLSAVGAFLLFPMMFGVVGIICGVLALRSGRKKQGIALIVISAIPVLLFVGSLMVNS